MKILKDGVLLEMTPELESEWRKEISSTHAPEPTIEERVASVEEDTAIIRAILLGEEEETK